MSICPKLRLAIEKTFRFELSTFSVAYQGTNNCSTQMLARISKQLYVWLLHRTISHGTLECRVLVNIKLEGSDICPFVLEVRPLINDLNRHLTI